MTDTITDWREVPGLTQAQRDELDHYETAGVFSSNPATGTPALYNCAVRLAAENKANADYAHIPVPAEATSTPSGWIEWDTNLWQRMYGITSTTLDYSTTEATSAANVDVVGAQYSDGRMERWIIAEGSALACLSGAQAREIAQALIDAADELDRLTEVDRPTVHVN